MIFMTCIGNSSILSIVSCRIFENEIIHLIKEHLNVSKLVDDIKIFVHKDEISLRFIEKLSKQDISFSVYSNKDELNRELDISVGNLEKSCRNALFIFIHTIPFSMEARPDIIKETVYPVISDYTEFSDSVLVMYGLCGNVLGFVEEDLSSDSCPVFMLRDEIGSVVDDCICASVGGRDKYIEIVSELERGVGIYFLTPMQAIHWKEISVASMLTPDPDDEEMLRTIFEYSGYKYAGKINSDIDFDNLYDEKSEEFSQKTNLEIIPVSGSFDLFAINFKRAIDSALSKFKNN